MPETWQNNSEQKTDILFLWEEVDNPEVLSQVISTGDVDQLIYCPGAVIWHIDRSRYSDSGMKHFVGTKVYKSMTARNCNTVRKLNELMK